MWGILNELQGNQMQAAVSIVDGVDWSDQAE
jgi:hypothetical protein